MKVRGLALGGGVTLDDIQKRQNMLKKYDQSFGSFAKEDKLLAGMDKFSQKAYAMMRSSKAREAFDLTRESASITRMFDEQSFSQSCLLASRLVQSGVKFVTLNIGGWDTHRENFTKLKDSLLPQLDAGLSGLLQALESKGLLESTAVFVTGEFGRTPLADNGGGKSTGRDHHPFAFSMLLAGGGLRGGHVHGKTDELGWGVVEKPVEVNDLQATLLHQFGLDHKKLKFRIGPRDLRLVENEEARVATELLG